MKNKIICSNVKAAIFQDANNISPKTIGYISVPQPTVTFEHDETKYVRPLDTINYILSYESENIKYPYKGNNYHWIITNFDISLNNSSRCFKKNLLIIKMEQIKCLASQHMHKYDFENKYDDSLKKLAKDLKGLIYDKFDKYLKQGIMCYVGAREYHDVDQAKKFSKPFAHNSNIMIKGYFIK
ncbi:hypothetical protein YYE_02962 [Plasmodium vinckei vinckei]|nr:hypothetical protein YYE_02962 [Plasmodium vinckei vinckei]